MYYCITVYYFLFIRVKGRAWLFAEKNTANGYYKENFEFLLNVQIVLFFGLKIDWVASLNSNTPFPYIFAPALFRNFNVVIAILLTMAKLNVILNLGLVSI